MLECPSSDTATDNINNSNFCQFIYSPLFYEFNRNFGIEFAVTPKQKRKVYQLRYQSYCIESEILDKRDYNYSMEYDELDQCSKHALVVHNDTGIELGTVRIILPDDSIENSKSMRSFPEIEPLLRGKDFVEISRFCLIKDARKKISAVYDEHSAFALCPKLGLEYESAKDVFNRIYYYAVVALIRSAVEMALDNDYMEAYAILESHLIKLLKKFGIDCTVIGPAVEYSGICYPVVFDFTKFDELKESNYDVWQILSDNGRLHNKLNDVYERKYEQLRSVCPKEH